MKKILGLGILGVSMMAVSAQAEVTPVPYVDLNQYIGKWYEIASIPQSFQKQCTGNTTAEYSFAERGRIKVLNSCDTISGKRSIAEGRAKVVDRNSNSKLKVTFVKILDWVFLFGGKYWILDLAPDYSYALIGDPSLKYAWILSRTPTASAEFYIRAEAKFRDEGYDTCQILTSIQDGGYTTRIPLCQLATGK